MNRQKKMVAAIALKNILIMALTVASFFLMSASAAYADASADNLYPYLWEDEITVSVGKTKENSILNANIKSVKSSDTGIATVKKGRLDDDFVVTGKTPGKTTIIVKTDNNRTLRCKVTVKGTKPKLLNKSLKIWNSEKAQLKVSGGTGKITWSTSDKKIASVSSKGEVTGKKAGTCVITAKRNGYTMTCKVTVPSKYKEVPRIPDFGALYGIQKASQNSSEEMVFWGYKSAKKYYSSYMKKLISTGFKKFTEEDGWILYYNSRKDIVAVYYENGITIVGIYR